MRLEKIINNVSYFTDSERKIVEFILVSLKYVSFRMV